MRLNFVEGFWGDMGTPKSLKNVEDYLNINNFNSTNN
jgi:hypothetical protein